MVANSSSQLCTASLFLTQSATYPEVYRQLVPRVLSESRRKLKSVLRLRFTHCIHVKLQVTEGVDVGPRNIHLCPPIVQSICSVLPPRKAPVRLF